MMNTDAAQPVAQDDEVQINKVEDLNEEGRDFAGPPTIRSRGEGQATMDSNVNLQESNREGEISDPRPQPNDDNTDRNHLDLGGDVQFDNGEDDDSKYQTIL